MAIGIMGAMQDQYGPSKGESVFYASRNKGTISGVDKGKSRGKSRKTFSKGGRATARRR